MIKPKIFGIKKLSNSIQTSLAVFASFFTLSASSPKNDKSSSLNNVINENSKSDFISKKIIESGFNKLRQENKKTKKNTKLKKKSSKRRFYINEKHIK